MGSYEFTFDASSFEKVATRLRASSGLIGEVAEKMILRAALMAEAKAKEEAPVRHGILRGSITHKIDRKTGEIIGRVGTNLDYAPYQEYGTGLYGRRHDYIYPRRARMLRFKTRSGQVVFARRVSGVRPKFFIKKGLQEVVGRIEEIKSFGVNLIKERLGFI